MEIRGKVVEINLDTQVAKHGGGTYPGATISFRDAYGKLQEKGFHANYLKFNAALKNGLENLQASDNFVAQAEKNDKDFWQWESIAKAGEETSKQSVTQAAVKQTASTGGNWATAEERAQTQVYIVRQSSITAALKFLELNGSKNNNVNDVILLAKDFENYVLGKEVQDNTTAFDDLEDDIPF